MKVFEGVFDGDLAAENIVQTLNAHECALRWQRHGTQSAAVEELIRDADHYSLAGTQILREHHGTDRAFVVDDGEHGYVVAYEEPGEAKMIRRRRIRRWLEDAPVGAYDEWLVRGTTRTHASVGSADNLPLPAYTQPAAKSRRRIEVGGKHEFVRWLKSMPLVSYRRQPVGWWYVAAEARAYVVDPRFYESLDWRDLDGDVETHYPLPPTEEPSFHLDVFSGRVSFRNPAAALRYARDLERAMGEQGVICSPRVVIRGLTDRLDTADQDLNKEADVANERGGLPRPTGSETEAIVSDLAAADGRRRRREDLENRLQDPNISDLRKARIRPRLQEARELELAPLERLAGVSRSTMYALALDAIRERDRLAREKELGDALLQRREEDLRRAMGIF